MVIYLESWLGFDMLQIINASVLRLSSSVKPMNFGHGDEYKVIHFSLTINMKSDQINPRCCWNLVIIEFMIGASPTVPIPLNF